LAVVGIADFEAVAAVTIVALDRLAGCAFAVFGVAALETVAGIAVVALDGLAGDACSRFLITALLSVAGISVAAFSGIAGWRRDVHVAPVLTHVFVGILRRVAGRIFLGVREGDVRVSGVFEGCIWRIRRGVFRRMARRVYRTIVLACV
jgi:hypothetical protein